MWENVGFPDERMKKPPERPSAPELPKTGQDLAEVERALSVLKGRHPEHERLERETKALRAKREAEEDATRAQYFKRVRARRAKIAAVVVVITAVLVVAGSAIRKELGRRAKVDAVAARWQREGLAVLATGSRSEPGALTTDATAGCVLATSTAGERARLHLSTPGGEVEGKGSIFTCLCHGGQVSLKGELPEGDRIVLLTVGLAEIGGSGAFAFVPFQAEARGATDLPCKEGSLDAWAKPKDWSRSHEPRVSEGAPRPPSPSPEPAEADKKRFLALPEGAALSRLGARLVTLVDPRAPFAVRAVPEETCVAVVPAYESEGASLRPVAGGLAAFTKSGVVVWCTKEATTLFVRRESPTAEPGPVFVAMARAEDASGMMGLRDALSAAAPKREVTYAVPAAAHAWNARQILVASEVAPALVQESDPNEPRTAPEARIVAVSVARPGGLVPDTPADTFSYCAPPLDRAHEAICAFSGSQKWRVEGKEPSGLAAARLPAWLEPLHGANHPAALKAIADLLTFARRMRREGFAPTTIEAVTETDRGASVLGRANEDAFLALGLAPEPPFVFPYANGAAWALDGAPEITPIKPLETVSITTKGRLPSKATRRTVVFRRRAR